MPKMKPQEGTQSNKRRQAKTSVACQACKSRKSKCNGGPPPCDQCKKLQTKCAIFPDADMRRRESKGDFRAFKALLDSFVASTRKGDVGLSSSLYRAIQDTDPTGRLAAIAQSYAQAISCNSPNQVESASTEFVFKWGRAKLSLPSNNLPSNSDSETASETSPSVSPWPFVTAIAEDSASRQPLSRNPAETTFQEFRPSGKQPHNFNLVDEANSREEAHATDLTSGDGGSNAMLRGATNFEDLYGAWARVAKPDPASPAIDIALPGFACEPCLIEPVDPLCQNIIEFRDGSRQALQAGANLSEVIGTAVPTLNSFFQEPMVVHPHSVWAWACHLARSFSHLAFPLQLATIYLAGIQMRFFIWPSIETFNDLPSMLRPLRVHDSIAHTGIDICHLAALKSYLFDNWDQYEKLISEGQSCNWPYSDSACLAYSNTVHGETVIAMSQAFVEHIRQLNNSSVGTGVHDIMSELRTHIRE